MKKSNFNLLSFGILSLVLACSSVKPGKIVEEISLPDGFEIHVFAEQVKNARSMAWGDNGVLFVGTRTAGNVYAIPDKNGDYQGDTVYLIDSDLNMPNGVAFKNGDLYVAEVNRIIRYNDIESRLKDPPDPEVIYAGYPEETHHGWKHIAFGPDGKLYIPVGAPCNICNKEDSIFSTITRLDTDTKKVEIFASGIRNTVGFDWHPQTQELWFTDNGRDWLGDNRPPDELNHAPRKGMHFGFPFCHGNDIEDPDYGKETNCGQFVKPVQELGPHVAALGMLIYDGKMFPEKYRGQVFIAEHGSWNRTVPIGYRITLVTLDNDHTSTGYDVFAEGWLQDNRKLGRPVDIILNADGSVLVSDDDAGLIYRITYNN